MSPKRNDFLIQYRSMQGMESKRPFAFANRPANVEKSAVIPIQSLLPDWKIRIQAFLKWIGKSFLEFHFAGKMLEIPIRVNAFASLFFTSFQQDLGRGGARC